MDASEVKQRIEAGLPGAQAEVSDLTGEGRQFEAEVSCAAFAGLSRVKQQQLVYRTVESLMRGEDAPLHALKLKTRAP